MPQVRPPFCRSSLGSCMQATSKRHPRHSKKQRRDIRGTLIRDTGRGESQASMMTTSQEAKGKLMGTGLLAEQAAKEDGARRDS